MTCDKICERDGAPCKQSTCNNFIDYKEDLNCTLICVRKHGSMTLEEVSKRMGVSYVRIKQIEDRALEKIKMFIKHEEAAF